MRYAPEVFSVTSLSDAKAIILTEEDTSTEERWEKETPYLAELAIEELRLVSGSVVLDYGCGVGRLARELISRVNCTVVGVDISASMRALSASYVGSPQFFSLAPEVLWRLGQTFDAVLSVWSLQHIANLESAISRIVAATIPHGRLFLVNNNSRVIPTDEGWFNDGADVDEALVMRFSPTSPRNGLSPEAVTFNIVKNAFWRTYVKP